jgi:ABC-type uncharacterized transport system ATPase subunit
MGPRKEVREFIRICEILIGCVQHSAGFTDEEYHAIAHSSQELEKEIFLYRVEHDNLFLPPLPSKVTSVTDL